MGADRAVAAGSDAEAGRAVEGSPADNRRDRAFKHRTGVPCMGLPGRRTRRPVRSTPPHATAGPSEKPGSARTACVPHPVRHAFDHRAGTASSARAGGLCPDRSSGRRPPGSAFHVNRAHPATRQVAVPDLLTRPDRRRSPQIRPPRPLPSYRRCCRAVSPAVRRNCGERWRSSERWRTHTSRHTEAEHARQRGRHGWYDGSTRRCSRPAEEYRAHRP